VSVEDVHFVISVRSDDHEYDPSDVGIERGVSFWVPTTLQPYAGRVAHSEPEVPGCSGM
jgi:hypothetical protein